MGESQGDHGRWRAGYPNQRDDHLAISINNGCEYCRVSHGVSARKAGMTEEMFGELMAVVAMASETNKLAEGYGVPVDDGLA